MANMSLKKNPMPSQEPDVRNKNFDEVALGYTEETGTVYPHKDARRGLYGRSDKGAYQGRVCCQNKNAAGR